MKKNDFIFIFIIAIIIIPFLPLGFLTTFQKTFLYNEEYWVITSFIKFALLATLGEVIGLKIKTGNYNTDTFGIVPRAIVWGFLGISIKLAFVVLVSECLHFLKKHVL